MNKIFHVIYSVAYQSYIVCSELAKSQGKTKSKTFQIQKKCSQNKKASYRFFSFTLCSLTLYGLAWPSYAQDSYCMVQDAQVNDDPLACYWLSIKNATISAPILSIEPVQDLTQDQATRLNFPPKNTDNLTAKSPALAPHIAMNGQVVIGSGKGAVMLDGNRGQIIVGEQGQQMILDGTKGELHIGNTRLNSQGISILNGPAMSEEGINAGNKGITNLLDGNIQQGSQEAVTGGQIYQGLANLQQIIGGETALKEGKVSLQNLGGTGKNTIDGALRHHSDLLQQGFTFVADVGAQYRENNEVQTTLGGKIAITGGNKNITDLTDNNIGVVADNAGNLTVKLSKNVAISELKVAHKVFLGEGEDQVKITSQKGIIAFGEGTHQTLFNTKQGAIQTGNALLDHHGLRIFDGRQEGPKITVEGIFGGNREIKNVKGGAIRENSTEVVVGGQLHQALQEVQKTQNQLAHLGVGFQSLQDRIQHMETYVQHLQASEMPIMLIDNQDFAAPMQTPKNDGGTFITMGQGNAQLHLNGQDGTITVGDKNSQENSHTVVNNEGIRIQGASSSATQSEEKTSSSSAISLSVNGLNNGGQRITNVAEGKDVTDAVNMGQLNAFKQSMGLELHQINDRVHKIDKNTRAGIAGAAAIATLPQEFRAGRSQIAIGSSYYRGESAFAIGYSQISNNSKWTLKLNGSTNSRSDTIVGAGLGYSW